jgi:hypothetical protein
MFPDRLPVECIAKLRSHPNLKRLEIWGDFRHDDGDTQRIKAELPGIVVEIR